MTAINQKEYLKKYLSIGSDPSKKKKKRKKAKAIGDRIKIIDDDVDLSSQFDIPEEELFATNEDAPQIVGVIDERPLALRVADYRKSDVWKPVGAPESDLAISVCEENTDQISSKEILRDSNSSIKSKRLNSQSTDSSNSSLPQKSSSSKTKSRQNSDSPSIHSETNLHRYSPRKSKDSDLSPPRKSRNSDSSPPRKSRHTSSPQRNLDLSPIRKYKDDPDLSPPRKFRDSSDLSPPRRGNSDLNCVRNPRENLTTVNSGFSPLRKTKENLVLRPVKKSRWCESTSSQKHSDDSKGDTSNRESNKLTKTLEGKTAGLQKASELAKETKEFREREDNVFKNLPENMAAIQRDKKTGYIRNLEEELKQQKQKQEKEDKNKEKYSVWGRGLKQVDDLKEKIEEDLHEMSKPLARYADDEDLERYLKEQEREGDPMLAYIRKKKKKEAVESGKPIKPQYEGEFMPNRFGIRPGYRWDGVDRSNGYEKKWFEVQNAKHAEQEDVYKWSTEDM